MNNAQQRASRKWEQNNPERTKYIKYRSWARSFVRRFATVEDMQELNELFEEVNNENISMWEWDLWYKQF